MIDLYSTFEARICISGTVEDVISGVLLNASQMKWRS